MMNSFVDAHLCHAPERLASSRRTIDRRHGKIASAVIPHAPRAPTRRRFTMGWHRSWVAWWYGTIALGFALLAIHRAILRERPWLIGLRIMIALGFGALAALEFQAKDRKH